MNTVCFYKIRHKKSGLYSKGGGYVNSEGTNTFWNKTGKTWDTLGKLRAHITSHMNKYYGPTDMTDWEVIEYTATPTAVKGIHEIITQERLVQLLTK